MRNLIKLFSLIVCAILLSFFSCAIVRAETARVATKGIGGYYHAYKNSSGTFSRYGQLQSFYIANGTYKNERVYCIAPGEIWYSTKDYTIIANTDSAINSVNSTQNKTQNKLTEEQLDMMSYYAYYGYGYGNHNSNIYIVATQMLIYRVIENQVFTNANCANGSCSKINDPTEVAAAMAEIQELVDNHFVYPSFNGVSLTLNVGETKLLTDTNGVLQKFQIKDCENCTATVNGNDLLLTATQNGNVKLTLEKRSENYNTDVMFLASSESQNMLKSGNLDPLRVNVTGTAQSGSLELYKTNEDGTINLSGASYNLYNSNHEFIAKLTTNSDGYVKYDNLPLGDYTLEEVEAPLGYTIDSKVFSFSLSEGNSSATIRLSDKLVKGYVEIYKLDSETNTVSTQGEAKLTGAKYNIYTENDVYVETLTINENNYAKSSKLVYGKYYLIESVAPEGYKLNPNKYYFEIAEADKTITINAKDDVIKGSIKITKYDSQNNSCTPQGDATLIGAIYDIYDKDNNLVDSVTIGNDCTATSKLLPYGTYKVKEKVAGNGYHIDETEYSVRVNEEAIIDVTSKEKVIKVGFELSKTDLSSGEPVANALIEISTIDGKLIFSDRTDKDGKITIKELPYGKYKFEEKEAPEGYVLNDEPHYFEIKEDGEIIKDTITNKKIVGGFELLKTDLSTGEPVENALIEIFNSNNELIYSGRTDSEGKIYIDNLEYGKYSFKESEAPEGYVLNDASHYFEIKEDGVIVKDTLSNEKEIIDVPKTEKNDIPYIEIISGLLITTGLGFILLKNRKKGMMEK